MDIYRLIEEKYPGLNIEKYIDEWLLVILNRNEDGCMKRQSMRLLGDVRAKKAVKPLIQILNDKTQTVDLKELAVDTLADIGGDDAIDGLKILLKSTKGEELIPAVRILGEGVLLSTQPQGLRKSIIRRAIERLETEQEETSLGEDEEDLRWTIQEWGSKITIPVETFPDSMGLIGRYFGHNVLKTLHEDRFLKKIYGDGQFDYLVAKIGGCLKFEMNQSLNEAINKYWTIKCENGLKQFYQKYGFFSNNVFTHNRLSEILGKEKLIDFYTELAAKSFTFKIKWCDIWSTWAKSPNILEYYVSSLKFKWGIKPEIIYKTCTRCNKLFNPCLLLLDESKLKSILGNDTIYKSISDINSCYCK